MKKLFGALVLVLLVAGLAWGGASSWSIAYSPVKAGESPLIKTWTATWIGSGSDGNVTSYTQTASDIAFMKDYYLFAVEADPNTPSPTAGWDITVVDSLGLEIATMQDFSATVTEFRYFTTTGGNRWYPPRDSTPLTIGVSGTTAPGATAALKFWLSK
jgi:hypothetical protein